MVDMIWYISADMLILKSRTPAATEAGLLAHANGLNGLRRLGWPRRNYRWLQPCLKHFWNIISEAFALLVLLISIPAKSLLWSRRIRRRAATTYLGRMTSRISAGFIKQSYIEIRLFNNRFRLYWSFFVIYAAMSSFIHFGRGEYHPSTQTNILKIISLEIKLFSLHAPLIICTSWHWIFTLYLGSERHAFEATAHNGVFAIVI